MIPLATDRLACGFPKNVYNVEKSKPQYQSCEHC